MSPRAGPIFAPDTLPSVPRWGMFPAPMKDDQVYQHLQACLDSLHRSKLLEGQVKVTPETVLLGADSPMDSIAFATFLPDLEDRLSEETGDEIYLLLEEIHEFNDDDSALTAKTLADYVVKLTS